MLVPADTLMLQKMQKRASTNASLGCASCAEADGSAQTPQNSPSRARTHPQVWNNLHGQAWVFGTLLDVRIASQLHIGGGLASIAEVATLPGAYACTPRQGRTASTSPPRSPTS